MTLDWDSIYNDMYDLLTLLYVSVHSVILNGLSQLLNHPDTWQLCLYYIFLFIYITNCFMYVEDTLSLLCPSVKEFY